MMPPVSTLVALADPTRCKIIELLHDGPLPVHVLASAFSISRPAISRHLRVLKEARLITEKKTGRENVYRLQAKRLAPVQAWIAKMLEASRTSDNVTPVARALAPRQTTTLPAKAKPSAISQMGFDF